MTTQTTKYLHRDHLGSVVALSREDGIVEDVDRMSFDAWGKRRANTWAATSPGTQINQATFTSFTPRGFTGHEHLDFLGVIHMNGRVYDAEIGRFLSADPFVQFPESTQGFNRYSYVDNNPLTYTDPSGFLKFREVLGMLLTFVGNILMVEVPWAGYLLTALGGYLSGGARGALFSVVSAGIFQGIGQIGAGWGQGADAMFGRALVSGLAGGLLSVALGGNFGDGFVGAFASSLVGNIKGLGFVQGQTAANIGRFVARVVIGGTISEISGGSFVNGAISAAFQAAVECSFSDRKAGEIEEQSRATDVTVVEEHYAGIKESGRLKGVYRDGNSLRGDVVVSCRRFGASGDCAAVVNDMRLINRTGRNGYSVNLNIREASFFDKLLGRNNVEVLFWKKDTYLAGLNSEGPMIHLFGDMRTGTAAHELGHKLGFAGGSAHSTYRNSLMYRSVVPGITPYLLDPEIKSIVEAYPRRN